MKEQKDFVEYSFPRDDWGRLRSVLAQTPSEKTFRKVLEILQSWEPEEKEAAIVYAEQHLLDWSMEARCVKLSKIWPSFPEGAPEPEFRLLRGLSFSWAKLSSDEFVSLLKRHDIASLDFLDFSSFRDKSLPGILRKTSRGLKAKKLSFDNCFLGPSLINAITYKTSLSQAESLHLGYNELGHKGVQALVDKAPYLSSLKELFLYGTGFGIQGAQALASGDFSSLELLHLNSNKMYSEGAASLASGHFPVLQELFLGLNHISAEGAQALACSKAFPKLKTLHLSSNEIADFGAVALAETTSLPELQNLGLLDNKIGEEGVVAIAKSRVFEELQALQLSGNIPTETGFAALGKASYIPQLRTLRLFGTKMRQAELEALLQGETFSQLCCLEIGGNPFGAEGPRALLKTTQMPVLEELHYPQMMMFSPAGDWFELFADAPILEHLRVLDLSWNASTKGGFPKMLQARRFAGLEVLKWIGGKIGEEILQGLERVEVACCPRILDLSNNYFGSRGMSFLANSPLLSRVEELTLEANGLGVEGAIALAESQELSRLHTLSLERNYIGDKGAEAITQSTWAKQLEVLGLSRASVETRGRELLEAFAASHQIELYFFDDQPAAW